MDPRTLSLLLLSRDQVNPGQGLCPQTLRLGGVTEEWRAPMLCESLLSALQLLLLWWTCEPAASRGHPETRGHMAEGSQQGWGGERSNYPSNLMAVCLPGVTRLFSQLTTVQGRGQALYLPFLFHGSKQA